MIKYILSLNIVGAKLLAYSLRSTPKNSCLHTFISIKVTGDNIHIFITFNHHSGTGWSISLHADPVTLMDMNVTLIFSCIASGLGELMNALHACFGLPLLIHFDQRGSTCRSTGFPGGDWHPPQPNQPWTSGPRVLAQNQLASRVVPTFSRNPHKTQWHSSSVQDIH